MTVAGSLSFDRVSVRLGARQVLRDVTFEVEPGEVVGLLGHNGAGKTTLLRTATRSLLPQRGEVRFGGRRLSSWSRRELARAVAVVPQEMHVPFPFRAGELVLMGRAPHQPLLGLEDASDVQCALRAMSTLGIESLVNRSVFELSGGERQLVLFARALAQEPQVLLLDEPTVFLDLRHRIDVLRVVRGLAREGRSALVVSHDLGLAARVCDRLIVLADGEVVGRGTPSQVIVPELLRQAFGIDADVVTAPDGAPLVVPRLPAE